MVFICAGLCPRCEGYTTWDDGRMTDKRWTAEGWTDDKCTDVSLRIGMKTPIVLTSKVTCEIEGVWARDSSYNPKFIDGIPFSHQDLYVCQFSNFILGRPHPPRWENR
jgi:hypothetical protein